jgi:hypothetical protein
MSIVTVRTATVAQSFRQTLHRGQDLLDPLLKDTVLLGPQSAQPCLSALNSRRHPGLIALEFANAPILGQELRAQGGDAAADCPAESTDDRSKSKTQDQAQSANAVEYRTNQSGNERTVDHPHAGSSRPATEATGERAEEGKFAGVEQHPN